MTAILQRKVEEDPFFLKLPKFIQDEYLARQQSIEGICVAPKLKPPIDLLQHDNNGCLSAVTANIMHMLGFEHPFTDPYFIDAQIGREKGKPVHVYSALKWVLTQAVTVRHIAPEESQNYLQVVLQGESTVTQDKLASETRTPIFEDLVSALTQGHVIVLSLKGRKEEVSHAGLAFGMSEENTRIGLYKPQLNPVVPRLFAGTQDELMQKWLPEDGIITFSRQ